MTAITIITRSVLIVDDDADALEEMKESLKNHDLTVYSAEDADEAIVLAHRHRPAFVLMDYYLPDTTGVEAASEIRQFLPETQIIMVSGIDRFIEVATTLNTDSIAVLKKPLSMDSIGRFISNRLSH